ncbi:DUF2306 domain-containing protein [Marinomonas sp. C2222]|uniref:DUF2306 domain-containing protein n=1 Tax=Marinomonas sargassi TaxID=2984494 RepID=A0ABT2YUQ0_9GAMM|nr:DUF2306 domain-containing protein [Marinomonas sargassi]MCV2403629.1 DUF2306 domain-containing protein [Marinomonas sargassi]
MFTSRSAFYVMAIACLLIALPSYRFLFLGLSDAFAVMPNHLAEHLTAFVLHITFSPMALILGVIQFSAKIRSNLPTLHRWVGRAYGVCILIGGLSGLIVSLNAERGIVAAVGFSLLSALWVLTTVIGIQYARNGNFVEHRRWMIRSFALTFAGVTFRVELLAFILMGVQYVEASVYIAWLCWVPNLLIVEYWLRKGRK